MCSSLAPRFHRALVRLATNRGALSQATTSVLILVASAATAWAVPARPDVIESLRRDGKLPAVVSIQQDARARGMDNPPASARGWLAPLPEGRRVNDRQAVVILVDFADNPADQGTYPPEHFADMLFSVGTYASGSMRDYYLENSYGQFSVSGVTTIWLRMPQTYAYYVDGQYGEGAYPRNAARLAEDAVWAADPAIDFSQFDNDGPDGIPHSGDDDGDIDALFIVHAGPGAEETGDSDDLWSFAWVTEDPPYVDGVWAYGFSQEPENGKIGVFSHEFAHVLGLPDLYDTDYSSSGVGDWCLMAGGVWGGGGLTPTQLLVWCKEELGFIEPITLLASQAGATIPRVETNPFAYELWTDGNPGTQYFLVENRQPVGFDASLPGAGLVICHVDDSVANNDDENHYKVAIEQADGYFDLENAYPGDDGDPWPGSALNRNFTGSSTPDSREYGGAPTYVAVRNISNPSAVMTADLEVNNPSGVEEAAVGSRSLSLGTPRPNPTKGATRVDFTSPLGAPARLTVFDPAGRQVYARTVTTPAEGAGVLAWDGKAANGSPLPGGVYFLRLEGAGASCTQRVSLVR